VTLEKVIVVVLLFVVWLALQGGLPGGEGATLGVPPRLKQSRLLFRFSLRTLLIVVTAIAVLLGILAVFD
jgi:hypothetical protein